MKCFHTTAHIYCYYIVITCAHLPLPGCVLLPCQICASYNKSRRPRAHQRGLRGCRNTPCFRLSKMSSGTPWPSRPPRLSRMEAERRPCCSCVKLWLLSSLADKREQGQVVFLVVLADKARGTFQVEQIPATSISQPTTHISRSCACICGCWTSLLPEHRCAWGKPR